ncbi:MAG: hypothetical protein PHU25_04690 [Deltaproteobacteria bacterium]|nr:hypothetical protein [Deltaproteobacteria bacterium]
MLKHLRQVGRFAMVLAVFAVALGCGAAAPKETTAVDKGPKGPDYQVWALLPKATLKADLPFIVGEGASEDTQCFKKVENLAPQSADVTTQGLMGDHKAEVAEAVRAWFYTDLAPSGLTDITTRNWTIEIDDLMTAEVPAEQIRFAEHPDCIDKDVGWLPPNQHAVTTLFGAKILKVKSSLPIDPEMQQELVRAASSQNMVIESPALFVYEPAVDASGNSMMSPEGKPLFKSPSGEFIPESQVPPPAKRLMKDFTLKSEKPLFFAFREIPNDAWRKESKKDDCDVFLIWDDLTSRPPECPEFNETAFSATKGSGKPIAVTLTTGKERMGVEMEYDETTVVHVNDRIVLWINPAKVDEGVRLRLNSLVLNPRALGETSGGGGEGGDEGGSVAPLKQSAPEEKRAEEKPEPKKKDKKKKSGDAVDDFLSQ